MAHSEWHRVSRRHPCPVCGKPDWCVFTGDEDAPTAAICQRVESTKRCGEAGWLHRLHDDDDWRQHRPARRVVQPSAEDIRTAELIRTLGEKMAQSTPLELVDRLAHKLGVTAYSLEWLGVGWLTAHRAWGFPMRDHASEIVGIRLRYRDGRKLSVKGGKEGLFTPVGMPPGDRLLVAEGPTDTAALLDLGFRAVGRPSCAGGTKCLCDLCCRLRPTEVVIVADADGPGLAGAERLASTLLAYSPAIRVITPPAKIKDAREWVRSGATTADVEVVIDAAEVRKLKIEVISR